MRYAAALIERGCDRQSIDTGSKGDTRAKEPALQNPRQHYSRPLRYPSAANQTEQDDEDV